MLKGWRTMTFYEPLTPYYDEIFPANPKALHFLASTFTSGGVLLDVGAGTGNMAIALLHEGFKVTAMEPEKTMAQQMQEKAKTLPLKISTKTMQQLDEYPEKFDGIYCIGNTLVHLNNLAEIETFLHQCYTKLNDNGILVFQIVNFAKSDFTFPVIKKDTFEFIRRYDTSEENILFTTTLKTADQTITNTTSLYPATAKQLLPILDCCGFQDIKPYGNFEKSPYTLESPALIIVAKK